MDDCNFCKIVKNETQAFKIHENDSYAAFLEIAPRNIGHTIVIPKQHINWIWDLPNTPDLFAFVTRIANALRKTLHTDWIISLVIGQENEHASIHLIPRFKNDGHGSFIDMYNMKRIPPNELEACAKKIQSFLQ